MKNPGKIFEEDFKKSLKDVFFLRLTDPSVSFNQACFKCPNNVTRFSKRNICDFVVFKTPILYLIELKSVSGKSIPFKNIKKGNKDDRLDKMVESSQKENVLSLFIVNFRQVDNKTFFCSAKSIQDYMNNSVRKSLPISFFEDYGNFIKSAKKRTRYTYFLNF